MSASELGVDISELLTPEALRDILQGIIVIFALLGGLLSIKTVGDLWREYQEKRLDKFATIEKNALKLINLIHADGFDPQLVIGIGRSGAFLGGWLAGNLGGKPIAVVERTFSTGEGRDIKYPDAEEMLALLKTRFGEGARVLVVEGASTTGATLAEFAEVRNRIVPGWECRYAVIYEVETSRFPCKYVVQPLKRVPKRYPWHKTVHYPKHIRRHEALMTL